VLPDIASDFVRHFSVLQPTALQHAITYRISSLQHIARVSAATRARDLELVARLRALRASGASEWLTVLPTEPRLRLSDAHWQWAARLRLGMPVHPVGDTCSGCNKPWLEVGDGWHSLSCVAGSGRLMKARHDDVVTILSRFANMIGVVNLTEPAHLSATDGKRPDVEFHLPDSQLLIDVTISHASAPSYRRTVAQHGVDRHGDDRATVKSDKYASIAESNDMQFDPFVLLTSGGWDDSAKRVLRKLMAAVEPAYCLLSRRDWTDQLTQQIAVAIQRGNAAIMINAAHRDRQYAVHGRPSARRPRVRTLPPRTASVAPADSASASRPLSSPELVSSLSGPTGLPTTSASAATAHTQHGAVSADDDAGLPAAVSAQQNSAAVQTRSPILFAASVRRCVSLPALGLNATVSDHDADALMQSRATTAAVVLHPAPPPNAALTDAAAEVVGAAAVDVHDVRVVASATSPDAEMMDADADADAELLLGHSDCKGDASLLRVSSGSHSVADRDDDDMSVMTDVDADCCGVEAEASRQQRQCVDSAEAELSCVRIAAVGAPAAATVVRRSRWREGGRGTVAA